jgi:4-hydroxybenzoate polyprenyltransferase
LARDIKLTHSVFALPFALLATFLAAAHAGRLPDAWTLGLIVLCMVLARTVAMSVNRLADAAFDAANPRTAGRAIPSGRLSPSFVAAITIGCAALFVVATSGFWWLRSNPYPALLSPLVLAWLTAYSFTKRFTSLCHLALGVALALSPLAAALAVEPEYLTEPAPYLLALMVVCWVAGFDIIYALQDVEVDRRSGLHSLPSRFGAGPALWVSRALHAASWVCLAAFAALSPALGGGFLLGVVAVGVLLVYEHRLVWESKTHQLDRAFFTVNGVISLILGCLGIVDVLRQWWSA